jgi:hypothetical protein
MLACHWSCIASSTRLTIVSISWYMFDLYNALSLLSEEMNPNWSLWNCSYTQKAKHTQQWDLDQNRLVLQSDIMDGRDELHLKSDFTDKSNWRIVHLSRRQSTNGWELLLQIKLFQIWTCRSHLRVYHSDQHDNSIYITSEPQVSVYVMSWILILYDLADQHANSSSHTCADLHAKSISNLF